MTELEISTGRVRGRARGGALLFAGIPYAAPPVGARRFCPPEPPTPWAGVRDATRFGPMAWQAPSLVAGMAMTTEGACDEDCLSLNVVTPALDGRARPVMVWIHGGSFTGGTGATPWYDGTSFATRGDVVVVTINYRLGALGFLELGELSSDRPTGGCNGLLDQIAALRWVRDNIAAFGGDPDEVTVFGESAGAMSIGCLLAMPEARGLFRRAITQSGAASATATPEQAAAITGQLLTLLEADSLADLRTRPPEAIVAAQAQLTDEHRRRGPEIGGGTSGAGGLALPFRPVVDGVHLPEPLASIRAGSADGIDLISGTNRDEFNVFLLTMPPDLDEARALHRASRWLPDGESLYRSYASRRPDATPLQIISALMTDAVFRRPSMHLLDAHAAGGTGRTHGYLFTWASTAFDGRMGSAHIVEIPYVWNNLHKGGVELLLGGPGHQPLADAMHESWWRFAHGEDPGHTGTGPWPTHDPSHRPTMRFDEQIQVLDDPDAEDLAAWPTTT